MAAIAIDRVDRAILAELVRDGRISNADLARKVGLSPSPCWQRVRRLEESGVISGYTALVDAGRLGMAETIMVEVMLARHDDDALDGFERDVAAMPEVLEAYLTTGEYDYLLKVAVANTAAYETFLRRRLYRAPGVRHCRSSLAIRCLKRVQASVP